MRRRVWLIRIGLATPAAAALLIFVCWLLLPFIARRVLLARLQSAGLGDVQLDVSRVTPWNAELRNLRAGDADQIQSISAHYSPSLLLHSRIDQLTLSGVDAHIGLTDGKIDPKLNLQPSGNASPASPALSIPLKRIDLDSSTIHLDLAKTSIPISLRGSLTRQSDGKFALQLDLTPAGQPLIISGIIGPGKTDADLSAASPRIDAASLSSALSGLSPSSHLSASGIAALDAQFHHGSDGSVLSAKFNSQNIAFTLNSPGSPPTNVSGITGVLELEARQAVDSPTRGTVTLHDLAFDASSSGLKAQNINGSVTFDDLIHCITAQNQEIKVESLMLGKTHFDEGSIVFDLKGPKSMTVDHTQWQWLGGGLSADHLQVQGSHIEGTFQIDHIALHDLLALLAPDQADGQGLVSGDIPLIIDWPNIRFGNGRLTSATGSTLQIKDLKSLSATLGDSMTDQEKANVLEALSDFKYDTLEADLTNDAKGLLAYVHVVGKGQTGKKTPLDLELNVRGLDQVLRLYLGFQQGISAMNNKQH